MPDVNVTALRKEQAELVALVNHLGWRRLHDEALSREHGANEKLIRFGAGTNMEDATALAAEVRALRFMRDWPERRLEVIEGIIDKETESG